MQLLSLALKILSFASPHFRHSPLPLNLSASHSQLFLRDLSLSPSIFSSFPFFRPFGSSRSSAKSLSHNHFFLSLSSLLRFLFSSRFLILSPSNFFLPIVLPPEFFSAHRTLSVFIRLHTLSSTSTFTLALFVSPYLARALHSLLRLVF